MRRVPFLPNSGALDGYPQSFASKRPRRSVALTLTSSRRAGRVPPPRAPFRRRGYYDCRTMRRVLPALTLALTTALVLAPSALAHDGGEGLWGETNDKIVTNAGFILIAFFPLFVFVMSMLQMALDRRKDRRKKALKALAREDRVRGGW